jgi:hypothetical protein
MLLLLCFIFGYLFIGGLIYIIRPDLVNTFVDHFPNLTAQDIPLSLLIFNYTFLAIGLWLLNKERNDKDLPLISGGIIAATSFAVTLNLSFIFNILWAAFNQKYLIAVTIVLYGLNLGIPLFIYALKKNSSTKKSDAYLAFELISKYRSVVSEIKLEAVLKKLDQAMILQIEAQLENQKIMPNELADIKNQLHSFGIKNAVSPKLQQKILSL